jgi:hypothetical protein
LLDAAPATLIAITLASVGWSLWIHLMFRPLFSGRAPTGFCSAAYSFLCWRTAHGAADPAERSAVAVHRQPVPRRVGGRRPRVRRADRRHRRWIRGGVFRNREHLRVDADVEHERLRCTGGRAASAAKRGFTSRAGATPCCMGSAPAPRNKENPARGQRQHGASFTPRQFAKPCEMWIFQEPSG